jgi:hypothetical protein
MSHPLLWRHGVATIPSILKSCNGKTLKPGNNKWENGYEIQPPWRVRAKLLSPKNNKKYELSAGKQQLSNPNPRFQSIHIE